MAISTSLELVDAINAVANHSDYAAKLHASGLPLRALLADLSLDVATFYGRYGTIQEDLIADVEEILARDPRISRDPGLSVLILFGRCVILSFRQSESGSLPTTTELADLRRVVGGVQGWAAVIRELYSVDAGDRLPLDWQTLTLHRLGTTSIIFCIDTDEALSKKLVLKVNHVLFTSIGPIAEGTRDYYREWYDVSRRCPYAVTVLASGVGWIVEEFVSGQTLNEYLASRPIDSTRAMLRLVREAFIPTLEAVADLHRQANGAGHGDLNPNNIILQRRTSDFDSVFPTASDQQYVARLIDMGRNLLASTTIGRVHSPDAQFVAPEVRSMPPHDRAVEASADYYSIGRLLVTCMNYDGSDGFYHIDERFFADQPQLARIAARLVDDSPGNRTAYVAGLRNHEHRSDPSSDAGASEVDVPALASLGSFVSDLVGMLEVIDKNRVDSSDNLWHVVVESVFGPWNTVGRAARALRTTWASRKSIPAYEVVCPARIVGSGLAYVLGLAIILYTIGLDYGRDPLTIGSIFSALGFHAHAYLSNWETRIVGATFLVACFQYNVKAYGGISFLGTVATKPVKVASEILLWILTVYVLGSVLAALFIDPRAWLLCAAVGHGVVAANNWAAATARKQIRDQIIVDSDRRRWYESSAIVRQARYDIFRYWMPTLLSYTVLLASLTVLAYLGQIHDWPVFAVAISVVNIFVFSYSQCMKQGPILAANLSQYVVAGSALRATATIGIREARENVRPNRLVMFTPQIEGKSDRLDRSGGSQ